MRQLICEKKKFSSSVRRQNNNYIFNSIYNNIFQLNSLIGHLPKTPMRKKEITEQHQQNNIILIVTNLHQTAIILIKWTTI